MKIAIATINKSVDSSISSRAGRAPYFIIFDENSEVLEEISNPFSVGGGGAGIAVTKMLADKKVDILVSGEIGDKMKEALNKRGLKFFEKTGRANEIIREVI